MSRSVKNRLYSITASLCSFVLIATVILTVLRSSEQAWGAELQDKVKGDQITAQAVSYLGTPYNKYAKEQLNADGGADRAKGFDSPLFVRQVLSDLGFRCDLDYGLPATAEDWAAMTSFMLDGTMYETEEPNKGLPDTWQKGDILFYGTITNPYAQMAIYVGKLATMTDVANELSISTDSVLKTNESQYWRIACRSDRGVTVDNEAVACPGMYVTKVLRIVKKGEASSYKHGVVEFNKTGEVTDMRIADATWRVYNDIDLAEKAIRERGSGNGPDGFNGQITTFTTDSDGHTTLELPNGKYYCVEWTVAPGSNPSNTIYDLTMNDKVQATLTNAEWYASIYMNSAGIAADGTESPVAGAEFTLYEYNVAQDTYLEAGKLTDNGDGTYGIVSYQVHDKDGNVIKTVTNEGENIGNIYYTDSNLGLFMIRETGFPEGYDTDRQEYIAYFQVADTNADTVSICTVYHYVAAPEQTGTLHIYNMNAENTTEYLDGSNFEIFTQPDCSGESLTEVITDANGLATFDGLNEGTYYIRQKHVKDGFFNNKNIYPVTIQAGQQSDITIPSEPKPGFINFFLSDEAYVTRDDNGNITDTGFSELTGATYNVYTDENCRNIATYVTWSDDQLKVSSTGEQVVLTDLINEVQAGNKDDTKFLMPGKYYYKEITAPAGYELDENVYSFEVPGNNFANVHTANTKASHKLTIVKRDALTDSSQGAAGFADTEFTLTADEDIIDPLTGVVVGKKGSVIGLVQRDTASYEAFTSMPETPTPTAVTGEDGRVTITGLYPGKYVISEVKAPEGYQLNSNEQIHLDISGTAPVVSYATVDGSSDLRYADTTDYTDCSDVTVYFYDNLTTRTLMIHKTDASTGKPVEGAGFSIYRLSKVLEANGIDAIPTDVNGKLDISELNLSGLAETFAEGKYNNDNTVLYTNENGAVTVPNLLFEKYLIVETEVPDGYMEAPAQIADMSLSDKDNNTADSIQEQNEISVNCVIGDSGTGTVGKSHPKTEATFELRDAEGNVISTQTTSNGQLKFTDIPDGAYVLTETQVPEGYYVQDCFTKGAGITIEDGCLDLTVSDSDTTKTNGQYGSTGGMTFAVNVIHAITPFASASEKTDNNAFSSWVASISKDHPAMQAKGADDRIHTVQYDETFGHYTYVDDSNIVHEFDFNEKGQMQEIVNTVDVQSDVVVTVVHKFFADEPGNTPGRIPKFAFEINKYIFGMTLNDHPEDSAEFELFDQSGNSLGRKSTENGYLTYNDIVPAEYTLSEIKAPDGFNRTGDIKITVADGQASITTSDGSQTIAATHQGTDGETVFEIPVGNSEKQLAVLKTDKSTGNALAGAKLELYRSDNGALGELVDSWTSEENAHTFDRISNGDYILHEAEAPSGYKLAEDIVFTISDDNPSAQITMADEPEIIEETVPPTEPPTEPKEPEPEPDFTYDPVRTGDTGLAKSIALMFISGTGLLVSVVLLILNNRKPKFRIN